MQLLRHLGGGKKKGIVDQNSPFFREEFPTLASGAADDKSGDGGARKEGDSKDTPYGPGPNLRPQSKWTCFDQCASHNIFVMLRHDVYTLKMFQT